MADGASRGSFERGLAARPANRADGTDARQVDRAAGDATSAMPLAIHPGAEVGADRDQRAPARPGVHRPAGPAVVAAGADSRSAQRTGLPSHPLRPPALDAARRPVAAQQGDGLTSQKTELPSQPLSQPFFAGPARRATEGDTAARLEADPYRVLPSAHPVSFSAAHRPANAERPVPVRALQSGEGRRAVDASALQRELRATPHPGNASAGQRKLQGPAPAHGQDWARVERRLRPVSASGRDDRSTPTRFPTRQLSTPTRIAPAIQVGSGRGE